MRQIIPGLSIDRSPVTTELRASTLEVGPTPTRIVADAGTSQATGRIRADVYVAGPAPILVGTYDQVAAGVGHRLEALQRYEFRNQDELWAIVQWGPACSIAAQNHKATAPAAWCVYWASSRMPVSETFDVSAWVGMVPADVSSLPFGDIPQPTQVSCRAVFRTISPTNLYMSSSAGEALSLGAWKSPETWRQAMIRNVRPDQFQLWDPATATLGATIPTNTLGYPGLAISMNMNNQFVDFLSVRTRDGQELVATSAAIVTAIRDTASVHASAGPDYPAAYVARTGPRGQSIVTIADHRARPNL